MEVWHVVGLIGTLVSTGITVGIGIGVYKTVVKGMGNRLEKVEKSMEKMTELLVQIGRQDERLNAIDQRMLLQGQRIDRAESRMTRMIDAETVARRVTSDG